MGYAELQSVDWYEVYSCTPLHHALFAPFARSRDQDPGQYTPCSMMRSKTRGRALIFSTMRLEVGAISQALFIEDETGFGEPIENLRSSVILYTEVIATNNVFVRQRTHDCPNYGKVRGCHQLPQVIAGIDVCASFCAKLAIKRK
jgi:hypothetical protein